MSMTPYQFNALLRGTVKNLPVFILYTASWCTSCNPAKKIFIEYSDKHEDIQFIILDVDDSSDLAIEHNISKLPTIKMFRAGTNSFDTLTGSDISLIKKFLDKNL